MYIIRKTLMYNTSLVSQTYTCLLLVLTLRLHSYIHMFHLGIAAATTGWETTNRRGRPWGRPHSASPEPRSASLCHASRSLACRSLTQPAARWPRPRSSSPLSSSHAAISHMYHSSHLKCIGQQCNVAHT